MPGWGCLGLCTAAVVLQPGATPLQAQGAERPSLVGEQTAAYAKRLRHDEYGVRWGELRLQPEGSLGVEYNDNIFYSNLRRESDVIIRPEVTLRGGWPVTELNTLNFSLGVGYNYYLQTRELDVGRPEINPGTEFAFNVFIGDVRIKLFDRFYYQDTLQAWTGVRGGDQGFISLSNVELFSRLDNRVGLTADWDLNDIIFSGTFTHENFISFTDIYNYLTRSSEQLVLSGLFLPADKVRPGIEIPTQYDDYRSAAISDQWRLAAGPVLEVTLTPHFNFRVAGGVQLVQFLDPEPGTDDILTYAAYAHLNHRVSKWMNYSLFGGHLNLPGWNAGNAATTSIGYSVQLSFLRYTTLDANLSWNRAEQTGGRYQQNYDYVIAGLRLGYDFNEHGNLEAYYGFIQKVSDDRPLDDYTQNRVGVQVTYQF